MSSDWYCSAGDSKCFTMTFIDDVVDGIYYLRQIEAFKRIQTLVLVTVFVLLLQMGYALGYGLVPFRNKVLRALSWVSYLLVPILISYILGLMGGKSSKVLPTVLTGAFDQTTIFTFRYLSCVWAIFLMFAYAGFDNLNAFSLEERQGRAKLLAQVGIQFLLLILIIYHLPPNVNVVAMVSAFIVLTFKFFGRLVALAHSAGATPKIKNDVIRIVNYSNGVAMAGSDYLVGSKYAKLEDGRIVEGITVDKVLQSKGRLLKEDNEEIKDTCFAFALFWLLLSKFWKYPLYGDDKKSPSSSPSRDKAWRFVRNDLLSEEGSHERVFRVIEMELSFLRDYFHARYIFFYLSGFYWKLVSIVALPAMFWWFIKKAVNQTELDKLHKYGLGNFTFTTTSNKIVISVVVVLELIQLFVFLRSRWLKVNLICFYVKKMASENSGSLSHFFLEALGHIFLGSWSRSISSWWKNPWKREMGQYYPWKRKMGQYSIVQSCTTLPKPTRYLFIFIVSIVGVPLSKPGRNQGKSVMVSDPVKKAVVLCLKRNETTLKLSNGVESLRRNRVIKMLPTWVFELKNDTETILVWHVATSVCELHSGDTKAAKSDDMKVATELSKYCAYLLFFAPSLLPVPSLLAENSCDTAIEEAMRLFEQPTFGCHGKVGDAEKCEKLMSMAKVVKNDEESGDKGISNESVVKKGAELGRELVNLEKEYSEKWRILAEFWTEMVLYLAPSNNNELDHAGMLSLGGEFITQLWALLIHAGIYDRDDIDSTFEQDDDSTFEQDDIDSTFEQDDDA